MTRPARTISCATLAEAADTLSTSPVELEVTAGIGEKITLPLEYLHLGICCVNNHVVYQVLDRLSVMK